MFGLCFSESAAVDALKSGLALADSFAGKGAKDGGARVVRALDPSGGFEVLASADMTSYAVFSDIQIGPVSDFVTSLAIAVVPFGLPDFTNCCYGFLPVIQYSDIEVLASADMAR